MWLLRFKAWDETYLFNSPKGSDQKIFLKVKFWDQNLGKMSQGKYYYNFEVVSLCQPFLYDTKYPTIRIDPQVKMIVKKFCTKYF